MAAPSPHPNAHDTYLATRRFGSLDGVRFLCILAVLWHHGPRFDILPDPPQILTRGFLGVDFFFVLSGYLITTLLLREEARHGRFSLRAFYWRRVCRIVPVYFLVVSLAAILFIGVKGQGQYLDILPHYYLFLSNFLPQDIPLLEPTWSLAVEEQYYLLWPLLLLALPRRWIMPALVVAIAVNVVGAMGAFGPGIPAGPLLLSLPTATYAPILMGSLSALILHNPRGFDATQALLGHRLTPLAAFATLVAVIQLTPGDVTGLPNLLIHTVMCLCLVSVVLREVHVLRPILAFRPIARVGEISYGIYLYHLFALTAVSEAAQMLGLAPGMLFFLAYVLLSILVSEISFRTFEAYFLRLKNKRFTPTTA